MQQWGYRREIYIWSRYLKNYFFLLLIKYWTLPVTGNVYRCLSHDTKWYMSYMSQLNIRIWPVTDNTMRKCYLVWWRTLPLTGDYCFVSVTIKRSQKGHKSQHCIPLSCIQIIKICNSNNWKDHKVLAA